MGSVEGCWRTWHDLRRVRDVPIISAHPCAFPRRLHQMWGTTPSTPPRGPLRQTCPERDNGKRFWLLYKRGVSKRNSAAQEQQKTAGERSLHEQGGAHREDRGGGRGD